MKSISEINDKIKRGEAIVVTASELCDMVRRGESIENVDIVTGATCGIMSGTMAIFSFKVAERGEFYKAKAVWMNGVPAFPGPCPNERLGIIDVIVYGTERSTQKYGGGALLYDLILGKNIEVEVKTEDGKYFKKDVNLKDMIYAKMLNTRACFKNYMAFVNPLPTSVKTIFSVKHLIGPFNMATVSGCGELNPLEKDPFLKTIGIGTKLLVNGAIGYVIGTGTRATRDRPNLAILSEIKGMLPEFIGQFITSVGPEIYNSIAIPIPIINEDILRSTMKLDEEIALPIANINDRTIIGCSNYGRVWQGVDLEVHFDKEKCIDCEESPCPISIYCPTEAFDGKNYQKYKCFECGACTWLCPRGAFSARLGSIYLNEMEIPIMLRQSCRKRAEELAKRLKILIERSEFLLSEPSEGLVLS
ncbi:MAG: methanogenesis marker 16 metalloprotein [Candidatus Methanomethyliaceae archaeon]|nr:methanogenesis marker 16 metalloprotein [Candidatus Methanomethyliaceae archaeon]MDW7970789.1 methanogenesis marker 16 metalloprotein [Nitrososphaerota archaeon]